MGLFRQGRTVKGKSGPPLCAEVIHFQAVNQKIMPEKGWRELILVWLWVVEISSVAYSNRNTFWKVNQAIACSSGPSHPYSLRLLYFLRWIWSANLLSTLKSYKYEVQEIGQVINLALCWILLQGQIVKKGQVVCYLEQLGTQQPVEVTIPSPTSCINSWDGT